MTYPLIVDIVITILFFVLGLIIGSFLNVIIYRVPRKLNFTTGRSMCPSCSHTLAPRDLVPIFSYIFLRGKCRFCSAKISPRYLTVELITGILFALTLPIYGVTVSVIPVLAFIAVLIAVCVIDFDTMTIPNGLVIALAFPAAALFFLLPDVSYLSHAIGFAVLSVPMYLLTVLIPDAFGGGDIKLVAVAGFALGWKLSVFAFFVSLVFGGGYAVYLLVSKKLKRGEHFAFGPFLSLGFAAAVYVGAPVVGWYASLLGF